MRIHLDLKSDCQMGILLGVKNTLLQHISFLEQASSKEGSFFKQMLFKLYSVPKS
jgi:hypothetical protein